MQEGADDEELDELGGEVGGEEVRGEPALCETDRRRQSWEAGAQSLQNLGVKRGLHELALVQGERRSGRFPRGGIESLVLELAVEQGDFAVVVDPDAECEACSRSDVKEGLVLCWL